MGPKSSSTFVDTGAPFAVKYGSGSVSGNRVTDNIVLAGLALNTHSFGVATSESDQFASNGTPFDGLMGLAQSVRAWVWVWMFVSPTLVLQKLSQQEVLTPPEALNAAKQIKNAIVSYRIARAQDKNNNGQVTFGGIDPVIRHIRRS